MAHRRKSKEDKNLIYIENKDKSSATIASKVILMYEDDFNLTISEIVSILKCERQWVNKYVQGNVKHIFLNEQYRRFLMEFNRSHSITEARFVLKDYYYFSRKDFYRWLKENTAATKQTQRLDINIYSDNISEFKKLRNEHIEALKNSKNVISLGIEVLTYEDKIKNTLSPLGQKIFSKKLGVLNRKDTSEVKLKNFNLPEELVSIKQLKSWYGKSLEIVYRDLYKYGATKYTIAGSLVRYDAQFAAEDFEQSEFSYLITIPYEYYIRKVKRIKKRRG